MAFAKNPRLHKKSLCMFFYHRNFKDFVIILTKMLPQSIIKINETFSF